MPRSKRSNANDDPDDIGGSMNVARGRSDKQAREKRQTLKRDRLSTMTPRERERMEAYLHGSTNADSGKKRLKALREDDQRMQMDGLTPVARQNLERRRGRGKPDKIMKARMEIQETKRMEAALANADAEAILNTEQSGLIETEHEMEKTYKLSQQELKRGHLDEQMARQIFDLKLGQYAPYGMSYDRSGRYGLLRGHGGGHVALMDCHTLALRSEFHVNEIVRDGTFLHNPTMLALAQKKNVFIYDDAGSEIHRMTDHTDIFRMQFLPYHWLLGEYLNLYACVWYVRHILFRAVCFASQFGTGTLTTCNMCFVPYIFQIQLRWEEPDIFGIMTPLLASQYPLIGLG